MLNKLAIAAVAMSLAAPAFAGVNPGNQMQADLLGVDATQFTGSQLAQIASEKHADRRAALAQFIAAKNASGIANAVASDDASSHSPNFGVYLRTGRD